MIFKSKTGELRLYDGKPGAPRYLKILFTNADLSFPSARGKPEEILNMDRGNFDTNASYSLGSDDPIVNPLPVRFSGRIDDTAYSQSLVQLMSGSTHVGTGTLMFTTKARSAHVVSGASVTTRSFVDSGKICYNLEVKYDGSTDFIYKLREVYFPPDQQTITEGEDAVRIDMNGLWYGSGGTVSAFTTGTAIT